MNALKEPQICTPLCLAMYMDVHKEGTGHLSPGGREREEAAAAPHELLTGAGQYYRHLRVFGCTCFVHIPAQLR